MVTWRLVFQGADVDGCHLLPPHLKSNQRQHHHLRHQDVVDLCSMDPHLRKPCIGLLLIFLVAHLEKKILLHQRQDHHLRHQDVVDLGSMDPLLRKPCLGLLFIFLVAHLKTINHLCGLGP